MIKRLKDGEKIKIQNIINNDQNYNENEKSEDIIKRMMNDNNKNNV